MEYIDFLETKRTSDRSTGMPDIPPLNPMLFDFQHDIVSWALRRGRAAIFADCGMGKTPMQLEWARHVPGRVLILAPLAVAQQTVREGEKFGIDVSYCRDATDITGAITITNYEMVDHFADVDFAGVVLDESSILKAYAGKFRNAIIERFADTPFRLACTATPAPNDYMELGNHSEFMGVMTRTEMLSMFFAHDSGETQKWRLKGHAQDEFWRWLCSWAVMVKKPSDLGYDDGNFILPQLEFHEHTIEGDAKDGDLFALEAQTLSERLVARRDSVEKRAAKCAELINGSQEGWVIWCNLNSESASLKTRIAGAVEIKGSDKIEFKESAMMGFSAGDFNRLVTKPSIAGHGMNWQHCHNVAFVGLSDSYEQFYQAVRRCWRFGQTEPVQCHIITADTEGAVLANIKRKEIDAERMASEMVNHMAEISSKEIKGTQRMTTEYREKTASGANWTAYCGDCVETMGKVDDCSIGYTIFSPPFSSLYTYSNSNRDMGNTTGDDEFFQHFGYLIPELWRATKPGRLCSVHCMDIPTTKTHHGYIGLRDFRGELVRAFESAGWIYHSVVTIWKDPVVAMQRTKALGLLHKQIVKDSTLSRQGNADYLITFRKPGENDDPVSGDLVDKYEAAGMSARDVATSINAVTGGNLSIDLWQRYASPVWTDINPSDTLQFRTAREQNDERHICPLQLDVIERGVILWSNPGDLVLSPFMGIASEGYQAVIMRRRFVGIELKESYFDLAVQHLQSAESTLSEELLFDLSEVSTGPTEGANN